MAIHQAGDIKTHGGHCRIVRDDLGNECQRLLVARRRPLVKDGIAVVDAARMRGKNERLHGRQICARHRLPAQRGVFRWRGLVRHFCRI